MDLNGQGVQSDSGLYHPECFPHNPGYWIRSKVWTPLMWKCVVECGVVCYSGLQHQLVAFSILSLCLSFNVKEFLSLSCFQLQAWLILADLRPLFTPGCCPPIITPVGTTIIVLLLFGVMGHSGTVQQESVGSVTIVQPVGTSAKLAHLRSKETNSRNIQKLIHIRSK